MFHIRAGRAGVVMAAAALIVPSPGTAADPEAASRPAGPDHYEHDFSDIAKYVKAFDGPDRDAWQKPGDVVSLLQLWPGNVVADIGAGTGHFEPYLAKAVGATGRVLALDVEPHMVTYLKARVKKERLANVTVQQVAANDPGLPDGSVDRLLVVNTWHHLPAAGAVRRRDEPRAASGRLRRGRRLHCGVARGAARARPSVTRHGDRRASGGRIQRPHGRGEPAAPVCGDRSEAGRLQRAPGAHAPASGPLSTSSKPTATAPASRAG